MRRKSYFFPLAIAALSLLSCATAPGPSTLTIELYDSRAVIESPKDAAGRVPLMAPNPPAPSETVASVRPGKELSSPDSGKASRPTIAGLTLAAAPRIKMSLPLAAPAVPAAQAAPASTATTALTATTASQAAASAQKAATTPAARPAPALPPKTAAVSKSSASMAAPPAAGGTGTAAGTTNATATPQTNATATPQTATPVLSNSYGRLREIFARQNDEVQIGLDSSGFLFLGFPDKSPQADGMSFRGKENRNNKTWFTFKALKLGTYDLDFLLQENTTGKSSKETVRVHVVSDPDFASAVNQQPEQGQAVSGAGEAGDTAFAARLSNLGEYESAIGELLKGYKDGKPALNDQIALLYMRTGAWDAAGKYYSKNLIPQTTFTPSAVAGLVRIAIAQKDQLALMSYLKQFLAITDPAAEETLIQAARMERERSETGVGLDLAAEYAARYPDGKWRDEADFLLAQLLENDSAFRDIARARELYGSLLKRFPESAFADAARERLRYIERHFYQVR